VLVPTTSSTAGPASAPGAALTTPSGTLRYANADLVTESLDPDVFEPRSGWAMYDSMLTVDARGNTVGNVAETDYLSAVGLTWTFNIRKGINFWNGDPLTAVDVVFSIERFGTKESTNPWSPTSSGTACPSPRRMIARSSTRHKDPNGRTSKPDQSR
jgi:ABC-type transport system substrate-binding protein